MNQSLFEIGIQNYYQLLVDNQVLKESVSPSTPDHPCCPICSHHLVICNDCSSVTCDSGGLWCAGADLARTISSCLLCYDPTLAILKKCSQDACDSCIHLIDGVICAGCITPRDIVCPCGDTWLCGACATGDKILDNSGRCPKCQNVFCFSKCKYIDICPECKKATLCNDCMELEDEDMHVSNEEGTSATKKDTFPAHRTMCGSCQHKICVDCFEERTFCCGWCSVVRCQSDMSDGWCADCLVRSMCWSCEEVRRCQECKADLLRSVDEHVAQLATSDSENRRGSRATSVDSESTSSGEL